MYKEALLLMEPPKHVLTPVNTQKSLECMIIMFLVLNIETLYLYTILWNTSKKPGKGDDIKLVSLPLVVFHLAFALNQSKQAHHRCTTDKLFSSQALLPFRPLGTI